MLKTLKKKKVWIPITIIAMLLIGYVYMISNSDEDIFVNAELVELRDIIHKVNASGRIQPEEEVQIVTCQNVHWK